MRRSPKWRGKRVVARRARRVGRCFKGHFYDGGHVRVRLHLVMKLYAATTLHRTLARSSSTWPISYGFQRVFLTGKGPPWGVRKERRSGGRGASNENGMP